MPNTEAEFYELNSLNPDNANGEVTEDQTTENERISNRRYKNIKIGVAICGIVFVTLLIFFLVIKPLLRDPYCPSDKTEHIKLKSFCSGISKSDLCTYRYHQSTNKCYKLGAFGSSGPCGENMLFYYQDQLSKSHLGECICDYNKNNRTLIKDPAGDNCYYVFQQGYCNLGYWLDFNYEDESTPTPVCVPSSCRNLPGSNLVPFLLKKQNEEESFICVSNREKSPYCQNSKKDYIIDFIPSSLYPICVLNVNDLTPHDDMISSIGSSGVKALDEIRTVQKIPPRS